MQPPLRLVCIAGTRPECLKLAALVRQSLADSRYVPLVLSSGQHPHMVAKTLEGQQLPLHASLPAVPGGTMLSRAVAQLRSQCRDWLLANPADIVLVQGDTSTAYAGALAARDCGINLAHLEAGLRTSTPLRPFPEEPFRRRISLLARWHFAPTTAAASHLLEEGVDPKTVHVVGNSIVDELRHSLAMESGDDIPWQHKGKRLLVMTMHRRENYQQGLVNVCNTVLAILEQHPQLCVVSPVHPNPIVGTRIRRLLGNHPRILLTEPLPYRPFIRLLKQADLVLTDSGGIQEEAPYLGIRAIVARTETERPEAMANGTVQLIGSNPQKLYAACHQALLAAKPAACGFTDTAPFGDGNSARRVLDILWQEHQKSLKVDDAA